MVKFHRTRTRCPRSEAPPAVAVPGLSSCTDVNFNAPSGCLTRKRIPFQPSLGWVPRAPSSAVQFLIARGPTKSTCSFVCPRGSKPTVSVKVSELVIARGQVREFGWAGPLWVRKQARLNRASRHRAVFSFVFKGFDGGRTRATLDPLIRKSGLDRAAKSANAQRLAHPLPQYAFRPTVQRTGRNSTTP